MAATYELIASTTLVSAATNITFSSIPATYDDLVVVASLRGSATTIYHAIVLQFNGVTTGYSNRELVGSGSGVGSVSRTTLGDGMYATNASGSGATANTFSSMEIYIPNYAGSTNKSVSVTQVSENNGVEAYATISAGLWSNTSAISALKLSAFSGHGTNLVAGSSAHLYGITKA